MKACLLFFAEYLKMRELLRLLKFVKDFTSDTNRTNLFFALEENQIKIF